jgi:hypothetical protein
LSSESYPPNAILILATNSAQIADFLLYPPSFLADIELVGTCFWGEDLKHKSYMRSPEFTGEHQKIKVEDPAKWI